MRFIRFFNPLRFCIGIVTVLFVSVVMHVPAMAQERAQIVAIVNDDIITTTDIYTRLRLNTSGRSIPDAEQKIAFETVLDELINETLQRQEARSLNINIDEQQIRDAFSQIAQNNGLSSDQFRQQLLSINVPVAAVNEKLRTDIAWSQVVRRKLRPQVAISETDIDAVFDDIERTQGKDQYRVAEIFVASDFLGGNDAPKQKVETLMQQILAGGSFPDIARRHSEAPGASRGGDLGWLLLEQMDDAFQPALLQMQPGQVSPPLRSDKGYHILLLIDKKTPQPETAPSDIETEDTVQQDTRSQKVQLQQIFIPVADDEPVAIRETKRSRAQSLKGEIQGCQQMQERFSNFKSPLTGDLGYVALADLPEQIVTEITQLEIGELSAPLANQKGIFVLMVCDRPAVQQVQNSTPSGSSNASPQERNRDDEQARDQIANRIGLRKLEALQHRYLRDLRAAAFIDRRL